MKYGSVCSGIEAATMAWHVMGWEPAFFSEIEPFPCSVLQHHYPNVPNLGDMTKYEEWPDDAIDLLVGGTPCQSFSVAGLRQGLADPRGNLMLTYLAIARRYQPRWLVWENVPGVLSSNGGRDFGTFIRGLEECGYHAAWRVLDAQFVRVDGFPYAVPQRRRRVFVVGYLGDWRRAAAVLLEREGMRGNPPPSRQAGKGVADFAVSRALTSSHTATGRLDPNETTFIPMVAKTLTRGAESAGKGGYAGRRQEDDENLVAVGDACLTPWDSQQKRIYDPSAFHSPTLSGSDGGGGRYPPAYSFASSVRRLTPTECERLQGFPDNFTSVPHRGKPAADGPRYKALGNSFAVNVVRWIGRRIEAVENITKEAEDAKVA